MFIYSSILTRELHGRSLESFICIKCRSLYRVIILCFIDTDMRRNWQPTPVFLPGKSHEQRSLAGYSPWGHKELDTTEQRTLSLSVKCKQWPSSTRLLLSRSDRTYLTYSLKSDSFIIPLDGVSVTFRKIKVENTVFDSFSAFWNLVILPSPWTKSHREGAMGGSVSTCSRWAVGLTTSHTAPGALHAENWQLTGVVLFALSLGFTETKHNPSPSSFTLRKTASLQEILCAFWFQQMRIG